MALKPGTVRPKRLAIGQHAPRVTFEDRVQAATAVAQSQGAAQGRSTLGIMDESNGAPSWFSSQQ